MPNIMYVFIYKYHTGVDSVYTVKKIIYIYILKNSHSQTTINELGERIALIIMLHFVSVLYFYFYINHLRSGVCSMLHWLSLRKCLLLPNYLSRFCYIVKITKINTNKTSTKIA